MSKKAYPYVDIMRVISSILVIGIHTYPFLTVHPTLHFIFTNLIGRIAVPFFFITTAFFLFQDGFPTADKQKKVLKQIIIIYLFSTLLYLPVQIYNQSLPISVLDCIKVLFIDGTFYHLWYFPATFIGISLVSILLKHCSSKTAFIIVIVLYIVGLGGDSYYGITSQIPILKNIYDYIFIIFNYTRNGIFFAPLYIYMGAYISKNHILISNNKLILYLAISFSCMFIESAFIHYYSIFKHDSMYVFLPLTMYYLYNILIQFNGKRFIICKNLSLYIYILHPLIIIFTRLVAKSIHLEKYLIANNFIHFLYVVMISTMFSYGIIVLKKGSFLNGQ